MDPHVTVRMQITVPPRQVFETVWNFPMDHFVFSEKDSRLLSRIIPYTIVITIVVNRSNPWHPAAELIF